MARPQPNKTSAKGVIHDTVMRRAIIERLIEKGKFKDAFKEAKLDFFQDASPENRQLIERLYILRIEALLKDKMPSAAKEVAGSMLEFGVRDAALMQKAVQLLPLVGLLDKALQLQGKLQSPEDQAGLLIKIADRAVLHPEETPASMPELREAAGHVRSALAAIDAGQFDKALEHLQPIPRSSPAADWRLFVRGLIAFRKDDIEQTKANWDRLDPQRVAHRIAAALQAEPSGDRLRALEISAFGEAVLDRLSDMQRALDAGNWRLVLQSISPLRRILRAIDVRYAQRLTDILLMPLTVEVLQRPLPEAQRVLRDFKSVLEPLAWDPHWYRFDAMLWERSEADTAEALKYWRLFVRDLEKGTPVPLGESRQVQSLVWNRIGKLTADMAVNSDDDSFDDYDDEDDDDGSDEPNEQTMKFRAEAVDAYERSIRLEPKRGKTYQALADLYTAWDQFDAVLKTLESWHAALPEDIDVLTLLIDIYVKRNDPAKTLSHIEYLRRIKPLDTATSQQEVWARYGIARTMAFANQWAEGRTELDRVEQILKGDPTYYRFLTKRVAFEFKAGDAALAENYLAEARTLRTDAAPLALALAIEMARYELPKAIRMRFEWEFQSAIKAKADGETAGAIAEIVLGVLVYNVEYPDRTAHIEDFVAYIKKTTRIKYRERDIAIVYQLLVRLEEEKLRISMLKRGLKLFPNSPMFIYREVESEIDKGPAAFKPQQFTKKLQKALDLAKASQSPSDAALVPMIQEKLAEVQDFDDGMAGMGLPRGGLPTSPKDILGMMQDILGAKGIGPEDLEAFMDDFTAEMGLPGAGKAKKPAKGKSR